MPLFIFGCRTKLSVKSPASELTARVKPKGRVKVRVRFRVKFSVSIGVSLNKNNSGVGELTDKYPSFFLLGNSHPKMKKIG